MLRSLQRREIVHNTNCVRLCQTLHSLCPVLTSWSVAQAPQLASLYYNDCQYVSNELRNLPVMHYAQLTAMNVQTVDFDKAANSLASAGRACLLGQVRHAGTGSRFLMPGQQFLCTYWVLHCTLTFARQYILL